MAQTEERLSFCVLIPGSNVAADFEKGKNGRKSLRCVLRFSWMYDTERVKHVIGAMVAPFFPRLSYGTYGTLAYSKSIKLGGIKLRHDITVFRKC